MTALFASSGVHAIVDGQFGSTGKGVLAAWLAEMSLKHKVYFRGSIYSGGPNSGHTFYHNGEKHVLKQLPTTAVAISLLTGNIAVAYLSAGAIINEEVLFDEAERYPKVRVFVHPNAAVVSEADILNEHSGSVAAVAGTRSGTGHALARKILRDPTAIWGRARGLEKPMPPNVVTLNHQIHPERDAFFMEIAQGFSLGINQPFYPKVTSRECTVAQGLADAGIPPMCVSRTFMSIRTFPIRVGNVDGFTSGEWYPDQEEITWNNLGIEPELTTVTKRERRVATFSELQFEAALRANAPDFVFANFLNYLQSPEQRRVFLTMLDDFNGVHGIQPFDIICGYGKESRHVGYHNREPDFLTGDENIHTA